MEGKHGMWSYEVEQTDEPGRYCVCVWLTRSPDNTASMTFALHMGFLEHSRTGEERHFGPKANLQLEALAERLERDGFY